MEKSPRVVVTGMGAVTAFGEGVGPFWRGALSGRSAIRHVTRFDVSRFKARQAAVIDREREEDGSERDELFARAAAREALASCPEFFGDRAALVLGTTLAGNAALTRPPVAPGGSPGLGLGTLGSLARSLAFDHGVRGPVSTVSVACASGSAAIGLGAEWIRDSRADRVLAGGADALSPFVFSGFDALRALSPTVARPFDAARDGLTLGEGAAFLLLEDEEIANRRGARILARVAGYGSGSDAHHMTRPDPSGGGLVRAIETALRAASRLPSEVGFVSAHGTGTTFNDAMEEAALAHVLGSKARMVPVNGIKGAIGHTLGAAGALEAILSVLVLNEQLVPPTAGHVASRPDSPLAIVTGVPFSPDRPIAVALSTSSAFGGINTALVLERA